MVVHYTNVQSIHTETDQNHMSDLDIKITKIRPSCHLATTGVKQVFILHVHKHHLTSF